MLMSFEETAREIEKGRLLTLAGSEEVLARLPRGHWIGGTIPYFMGQNGGEESREKIFVQSLPESVEEAEIRFYDAENIPSIAEDAPDNGFTLLLIPATSRVHLDYAANAPGYEGMFLKPIIGWITGVHLGDLGKVSPKVFNGETGAAAEDRAAVLHARLPVDRVASTGIVNLFTQGDSDAISFPETGFSAVDALVAGERRNLADYIAEKGIDTRLPLVANYQGAMINVSFQSVDRATRTTHFYAPVFAGVEYRQATPVADYVKEFQSCVPSNVEHVGFSCNCILNYLYSELEGKRTANLTGPMTFGEVAYQLLNQTLVYLSVKPVKPLTGVNGYG
ncbi:MAG: hypothetical protein KJ558_08530 [Gammaproteobacteria bacterium]|nr:hypothetical protein [Gammaproteobacteria bacterium]MBU1654856.1 hypothetical protein [Gammaproteobacteria bacterium]MBU1961147.1 hypothetical protein [Gammaproteobacteria bacterium]